jgi:hypothetical protein
VRIRLGAVLVTALTIVIALVTLTGLVGRGDVGTVSVLAGRSGITSLTELLLQTAGVVAATAVLVGVFNLLTVHIRRVRRRGQALYSALVVLSFVMVVGFSLLAFTDERRAALDGVQIALETAFSGLLLFSLVYGAVTVVNRRPSWSSVLFVLTVIVVLIGSLPLAQVEPLAPIVEWINAVPVDAGGRALLLGIALATVVAGVRVLIGQGRATRE